MGLSKGEDSQQAFELSSTGNRDWSFGEEEPKSAQEANEDRMPFAREIPWNGAAQYQL